MEPQTESMDIPRNKLITKLTGYISEAQKTPLLELCKKGDYSQPHLRYPQTKGEYLADSMSTLLASQSWIDGESEPVLDDILGVLGPLDINVNQPEAWKELFEIAKEIQY